MTDFFTARRQENFIFVFLVILLASNALVDASVGFIWPLFFATVPLAALLAFFFPRAGFAAVLVLTITFERFFTLQPIIVSDTAYKLYPLDIMLTSVFASAFLLYLQSGKKFFTFRGLDMWLLGFFVLITGIFLYSIFGFGHTPLAVAFSTWKNYVFYGGTVFFLASTIKSQADLFLFVKIFLAAVAVASIFLVMGIVRGGGLWTEYTPLSTPGTRFLAFPHAFYFSLAFTVLLLALPLWYRENSKILRLWIMFFVGILAVGIMGSLMRHLWLGLTATLMLAFLAAPLSFGRIFFRFSVRYLAFLVILLSGMWFYFGIFPMSDTTLQVKQTWHILEGRLTSIGNAYDESFAWRSRVWQSAIERFAEHPVLGIGFGVSVPVELDDYAQYVEVRNMHNSWLGLIVQTGLLGTLLFFGFVTTLFVALIRKPLTDPFLKQARFVLSGLMVFQGLVFFSQPYLETNLLGIFFWMTLGIARAFLAFPEDKAPSQQSLVA